MAKRRGVKTNKDNPQLEMTPMIDCVFQLLIFFIISMAINQTDILSNLEALRPAPDPNPKSEAREPVTILVGKQGFFFDGALLARNQLESQLRRVWRTDAQASIIIKCTNDSPHGYLVEVLDTCYKVGLLKLSVFSM